MKKTLFFLVALLTATIAFAQTEINGIYYNLNNETKTAEVTYQDSWFDDNYSGVEVVVDAVDFGLGTCDCCGK